MLSSFPGRQSPGMGGMAMIGTHRKRPSPPQAFWHISLALTGPQLRSHTCLSPMTMAMRKWYPDRGWATFLPLEPEDVYEFLTGRNKVVTSCVLRRRNRCSLRKGNRYSLRQNFLVPIGLTQYCSDFVERSLLQVLLTPEQQSSYASSTGVEK